MTLFRVRIARLLPHYYPLRPRGCRFIESGVVDESTTRMRRFGGRLISLSLATLGRMAQVKDPTSGFRVYSQKAAALLAQRMPDEYPEPESVAVCAIQGLSIAEMPVRMHARGGGESSVSGWKSAVFMVKVLTSLLSFRVRCALGRADWNDGAAVEKLGIVSYLGDARWGCRR